MRITPEGDQIVIHHGTPGDLFGIAAAIENPAYSLTAKWASDGKALVWPAGAWPGISETLPGLAQATRRAVSARMHAMQDTIVEMATRPVAQRIALSLMRLADQAGRAT